MGAQGGSPAAWDLPDGSARRWSSFLSNEPGLCLPFELPLASDGTAACKIFMLTADPELCACDGANRGPVSDEVRALVRDAAREQLYCDQPDSLACADHCVCENLQAIDAASVACRAGEESGENGWCYVAPERGIGEAGAVGECPSVLPTEPHFAVRFAAVSDEIGFMTCSEARPEVNEGDGELAPLGSVCVPSWELDPTFTGFYPNQLMVDDSDFSSCASGACLIQRFRGRVSCPLGNVGQGGVVDGSCLIPGSKQPVVVAVPAQLVDRPPSLSATCSCRCDGPGDGPFCECAEGQDCVPLIDDLGLPGDEYAGSYCVPHGAADGPPPDNGLTCDIAPEECSGDRPY